MNHALINFTEIAQRLMDNKKVSKYQLERYFSRRHTNPIIQWQWEALTTVEQIKEGCRIGVIHFPNGSTREFESTRIR